MIVVSTRSITGGVIYSSDWLQVLSCQRSVPHIVAGHLFDVGNQVMEHSFDSSFI